MSATAQLRPMTDADFAAWCAVIVPDYAAEKVANGAWRPEEALQRSQDTLQKLLPLGLGTPGQHLYTLHVAGDAVGYVWFGAAERDAYLYDLYILPAHRRRGHGRTAMRLLEGEARAHGYGAIALHVFGHNTGARDLYLAAGYAITDLNMRKVLG